MTMTSRISPRSQTLLPALTCALVASAPALCQAQEIKHSMLRPPLTAYARFGAATESFDLRLDNDGLVYVSALVNGKPALFLLDSLWGIDALTEDAAKRLGIDTKMDLDPSHPSATIQHLQIGSFDLQNDPVTIQPSAGWKTDGLLGFGFFSQAVVGFHWASKTMTLSDPARFKPPVGYEVLPLTIAEDRSASVDATLDDLKGRFLLAFGMADSVDLYPGFVAHNNVREKYMGEERAAATPPADNEMLYGKALTLGSVNLNGPYLHVGRPDPNARYDVAGRFGDSLLKRMDESVDYPHRQMFVLKNGLETVSPHASAEASLATGSDRISFAPIYIGANKTHGADSPAENAQMRLLAQFQRQFTKLASDTGPVTAYSHFCTPNFTMSTKLFGSVQQVIPRAKFIEMIRGVKKSDDISSQQAFSIFECVRSIESGTPADDTKLSYTKPDTSESRGNQIVYSNYPVITSNDKDNMAARATFAETFVRTGKGLMLKSIDLINIRITAKGVEMPAEFVKALFSADPEAALKTLTDSMSKESPPAKATGK